jgi:cupin fold WbuC family metalloprotein
MKLKRLSADAYLAEGPVAAIGQEEIDFLRSAVAASPRGRVRINAHPDGEDLLHEMFIAIRPDSYIRPHKHPGKSEAFHLIHGSVDIVVFDDAGEIREIVPMAANEPGRAFYYRLSEPLFHTLVIRSDLLVVHEITNGPFRQGGAIFAPFAPEEGDKAAAGYQAELMARVSALAPT